MGLKECGSAWGNLYVQARGAIRKAGGNVDSGTRAVSLRRAVPYVAIYILAAVAIPLFFSGGVFKPFPKVELYTGALTFSGERAYADLETLVDRFPTRYAGMQGSRLSANWVQEQLKAAGLDARIEEFDCLLRDQAVTGAQSLSVPVGELTYLDTGYNVIAVSPGESREAVIIGAHRDTVGNGTGAEDDGSGTVAMIELARVLTAKDHYYTYVFASWDGEEAGLRGSEAYAATHKGEKIKIAISLDMVGFNRANTLGFVPSVSSRGSSAFWTTALAEEVAEARGLPVFRYGSGARDASSPAVTFWQMRSERLTGTIPTDSGPFIDRNVPGAGFIAAQSTGGPGEGLIASIHSLDDTIDQVSPKTLLSSGQFVEQYVRSIELNRFGWVMNGHLYFIAGDKAIGPLPMTLFELYASALVLALGFLTWKDSGATLQSFGRFLRHEWAWIASALGVAAVVAVFPLLAASPILSGLSLVALHLIWIAVAGAGLGAAIFLRARAVGKRDVSYHEATAMQKVLLNIVYAGTFFVLLLATNPFLAISCSAFPLLFLGRLNFRSDASRVLTLVASIAWMAFCVFNLRNSIMFAVFYPFAPSTILADLARALFWTLTPVYLFTAPRRGITVPTPKET